MAELPVDEKASHKEVHYERTSEHLAESCGDCRHVIEAPETRCESVASPIYLNGWCVRFAPKEAKKL
jgi:hypothetical protein